MNQTISEIINRKPRFICIEDLNVSGMMKNRHLSKAVQEQGFFWFRKQLEYRCSDKGIQLIVADRFYPSSKLCSCCGNIKKDLKLSDRVYRCACWNMIDIDFQASINLKTYGEKFASWHWNVNANMYGYLLICDFVLIKVFPFWLHYLFYSNFLLSYFSRKNERYFAVICVSVFLVSSLSDSY